MTKGMIQDSEHIEVSVENECGIYLLKDVISYLVKSDIINGL